MNVGSIPRAILRFVVLVVVPAFGTCLAVEWPYRRGNPEHTGVTDDDLSVPLHVAWRYRANCRPSPAFRGGLAPASGRQRVESITYDYVFEPIVAGGRLFFGSSAEEAVFCRDASTGGPLWTFHAQGPVRLAPCVVAGRLYFGSDDGYVYCLDPIDGGLLWKVRASPDDGHCIGNGRIISAWPVRTSVAVAEGVVYFGAGLFPTLGTYLCAVDADCGEMLWRRRIPYSPHGEIVVDGDLLLIATGRTAPAEFHRSDGTPVVEQPDARRALGGSSVGMLNDMLVWGPDESGVMFLRASTEPIEERGRRDLGASVSGRVTGLMAHSMAARDRLYLVQDEKVLAVDWQAFRTAALANPQIKWRRWEKSPVPRYGPQPFGLGRAGQLVPEDYVLRKEIEAAQVWSVPNTDHLTAATLCGRTLVVGGKDQVVTLDSRTGQQLWFHDVEGEARGLAVAGGRLFVSTDHGEIYCFDDRRRDHPVSHVPQHRPLAAPDPWIAATADAALRHADPHKGFCLIAGVTDGGLATEIARRSEFFVVAIDKDAREVAAVRDRLTGAGLYGKRVVVHHVAEDRVSYPAAFANLILSEDQLHGGPLPYPLSAVLRLLRPYGGTLLLRPTDLGTTPDDWQAQGYSPWQFVKDESGRTWQITQRGDLPGAGQWTHMYADPANTLCSGDRLGGSDLRLQWFGPPGADDVVERHAVAMPPLFKGGKLFVAGRFNSVQAIDAYNGTSLWKVAVPESTRMMLSHNAGFLAAGRDALYVAADESCWMLDENTGSLLHKFVGPDPESDWGYVGVVGDYLLGTNQKTPADQYSSGTRSGGYRFLTSAKDLHSRPTVSENLFAYDCQTRERVWKYERAAIILNPTITVGAGCVYFAESRNPKVLADETGTTWLPDFFAEGARLVAVDLHSGEELWSKPLGPLSDAPEDKHEHIMFLSYADGLLLATRTGHIDQKLSYRLEALDAATGETNWKRVIPSRHRVYAPLAYGKNGQQSHPSIVGDKIYLLSHITDALITADLNTGEIQRDPEFFNFWIHSKTCAVPTASETALYFRRNSCYIYDLRAKRPIDLTAVTRPGCWMSIIPAGGLVLMPEASSGCTCGFALQTSVVLAPAAWRTQ